MADSSVTNQMLSNSNECINITDHDAVGCLLLPRQGTARNKKDLRSDENLTCIGGSRRPARSIARPWARSLRVRLRALRERIGKFVRINPATINVVLDVLGAGPRKVSRTP